MLKDALFTYLIVINVLAFIMYGIDKIKAVKGAWRISESFLITLAALGGGAGALAGMRAWHHKTRKWKFKILVPLFLVIWTAGLLVVTGNWR
ncbi:DUF1294 domain-containing protein [Oribacterium sp. WCC10]|uniref:DUF1294 domain-containing protein n=1 Tax=Oribacterium sp. WCC10 TaxID=1855343 RepID=UPI0008E07597|nr:DUF1294 domain-containing protein [Oribacterium sp. WCC10]SFG68406.1 Uncharacterized membrane protein YsdA, DUF1294 family [Oribacterium sp. WCC10]